MKYTRIFSLVLLIAMSACSDETTPASDQGFVTGKNRFTTMVDGDEREYYVHVPTGYDGSSARPVVFMLHGTSGDGEKFYNISGWKEVGEKENILTVFPSSWRHCITDEDGRSTTTKWNIYPGSFEYCAGEIPRDDVKFLRQIISELKAKFTVDEKRIYVAGFSNGGQMAFRCAVEMGDVFAAAVENAGSSPNGGSFTPRRTDMPVVFQFGNEDDRFFHAPVPLSSFEAGFAIPYFQNVIQVHTSTFHCSTAYTITGDTNTAMIATFPASDVMKTHSFNIVMVNGLAHAYPNGTNHWMKGAERHWEWMKKHTLP
ncbi:MAG: prolyl oligopeptidase family serine peptidase [Bacteroidia bacterium]|nr:prolyl oligopeptidase family serine peptidase [Bacteroidia bacterium]